MEIEFVGSRFCHQWFCLNSGHPFAPNTSLSIIDCVN